ncbi:multiple epidermal growth factor-like domains protein 10 [Folsomia candida]|uniref:multiple epidermal growth factor-like domains protein 10 n=1 Tax=Folsomia candida TaxID=158441 RepID=UPI000B8FCB7B|nr:multiple epidermal growth factor-like domains protein 10 [Folsomia candida]
MIKLINLVNLFIVILLVLNLATSLEDAGSFNQQTCPLKETHWSSTQLKCVAQEGSSCSGIIECTDNAGCHDFEYICRCNNGYGVFSRERYCLPSYGSSCTNVSFTERPCNPDNFLQCNATQMCDCQSGYIWDGSMCLAQPGQKCDLKVTTDMTKASLCIPSAECTPGNITGGDSDPSQLRQGTCQCPSGTRPENGSGICSSSTSRRPGGFSEIFLALLITRLIF